MARLMKVDKLAPSEITVGARLRPVSDAKVEALMASFQELGVMMHPIQIVKHKGKDAHSGGFELVAGMHRLHAAMRLEWSSVPVRVWADVTKDWTELMELDENLSDPGMTALDTAVFLAKRKRIYETRHPETKRGRAGAKARHDATELSSVATFSKVVSQITGTTDRQVRNIIRAGEVLEEREVHALRRMQKPANLSDLIELSKITDPAQRRNIVTNLALGKAASVKEAQRAWKTHGVPPLSNDDQLYIRLAQAWENSPKKGRRVFVEEHRDELLALLGETAA